MPSFDIVSELNLQEVDNAVHQTEKEIATRFDFRGAQAEITFDKTKKLITLVANSEQKIENMLSVLQSKAIKRQVDIKCLNPEKIQPKGGNLLKQDVLLKEGIDKEFGKKINSFIKDLGMKIQSGIHDDKVRVTGKQRDDLQQVMQALRGHDFELPLQFKNFRDN